VSEFDIPSGPEIRRLVVGPLEVNCYLLICPRTRQCICVDPGGDPEAIMGEVERKEAVVKWILLTHGHADHAAAAPKVSSLTGAPVLLHKADWPLVSDPAGNQPLGLGLLLKPFEPQGKLVEGQVIRAGEIEVQILHTPGHTPGSVSLLFGQVLICGDLLFAGSVGRTDLPGGDFDLLLRSIREKIAPLPDGTLILPGHGPKTTVGQERRGNPFFAEAMRR